MDKDFSLEKKNFIETYNLARPIMTILGRSSPPRDPISFNRKWGDGRNSSW